MERSGREQKQNPSAWIDDPVSGMDIESILAETRRYIAEEEAVPELPAEQEPEHVQDADHGGITLPDMETQPPDNMDAVALQIKELTEEVRQLRSQLSQAQTHGEPAQTDRSPNIQEAPEKSGKSKALSIISNVLFYLVIFGVVIGALLIKSSSGGKPTVIAGFSAFRVLSSSMEDVYPKGSLIVSKSVDPNELAVGDDITFMVSETSSITHRIIGITQNYAGTGKPGFETQGTMNEKPDKDMVAAANVVGKVVFSSKALGDLANFMKNNWPLMIFITVVLAALITFLKWNARREDDGDTQPSKNVSPRHVRK